MKRTTVSLPEDVAAILAREARRRAMSVSEVTRQALIAYLGLVGSEPRRLPFEALGRSGYSTTAEDIEEILAKEWRDPRHS